MKKKLVNLTGFTLLLGDGSTLESNGIAVISSSYDDDEEIMGTRVEKYFCDEVIDLPPYDGSSNNIYIVNTEVGNACKHILRPTKDLLLVEKIDMYLPDMVKVSRFIKF